MAENILNKSTTGTGSNLPPPPGADDFDIFAEDYETRAADFERALTGELNKKGLDKKKYLIDIEKELADKSIGGLYYIIHWCESEMADEENWAHFEPEFKHLQRAAVSEILKKIPAMINLCNERQLVKALSLLKSLKKLLNKESAPLLQSINDVINDPNPEVKYKLKDLKDNYARYDILEKNLADLTKKANEKCYQLRKMKK